MQSKYFITWTLLSLAHSTMEVHLSHLLLQFRVRLCYNFGLSVIFYQVSYISFLDVKLQQCITPDGNHNNGCERCSIREPELVQWHVVGMSHPQLWGLNIYQTLISLVTPGARHPPQLSHYLQGNNLLIFLVVIVVVVVTIIGDILVIIVPYTQII